jgi:regulator of sigma D
VSQENLPVDDADSFVENLVRYEREGVDLSGYEKVFERIYRKIEEGNTYFRPRDSEEEPVFRMLDRDTDMMVNWHDSMYGLQVDREQVEVMEDRLDLFFDENKTTCRPRYRTSMSSKNGGEPSGGQESTATRSWEKN